MGQFSMRIIFLVGHYCMRINNPGVTLSNICPESEEKAASLFSSDEWTKYLSDVGNLKPLAKNTKKEGKNMGAGK